MKYSGDLHIFDFDDTLMWSADWYSEASLDRQSFVKSSGKSRSLKKAILLLNKIGSLDAAPHKFKNLRLRKSFARQLNRRNIFFVILDSDKHPVLIEDLEVFVSAEELADASIKGSTQYSLYASVTEDFLYYRDLDTVGTMGPNDKIMDIYKSRPGEGIVLTARGDIPGLRERISDVLAEYGGSRPVHVYAQPPGPENSGTFKAKVLLDIANQDSVNSIQFYEDNPEYIKTILNFLFLERFKSEEKGIIVDKIYINPVSVKNKPDVNFKS